MHYTLKDILHLEVTPALGCTEPIAVALAAAAAAQLLPDRLVDGLDVLVDPNVFKNGRSVAIPGAGGRAGLALAGAMGALAGDAAGRLEVMAHIAPADLTRADALVASGAARAAMRPQKGLYVRAAVRGRGHEAVAVIQGRHDRIVELSLDGRPVTDHPLLAANDSAAAAPSGLADWLVERSIEEMVALAATTDAADGAFLLSGVEMNLALAQAGLADGPGLGLGKALSGLVDSGAFCRDMGLAAKILTAAGADARLAGYPLAAMSSAGSGTQGVGVTLGLHAAREFLPQVDEAAFVQALALAHILTSKVKAHIGRLSAMCGCVVAAGGGVAGALTRLMGGDATAVGRAVATQVADLAGVVCDGAKGSCALKLASAVEGAVQAAHLALAGFGAAPGEGLVGRTPEATLAALGRLAGEGMADADAVILDVLACDSPR